MDFFFFVPLFRVSFPPLSVIMNPRPRVISPGILFRYLGTDSVAPGMLFGWCMSGLVSTPLDEGSR